MIGGFSKKGVCFFGISTLTIACCFFCSEKVNAQNQQPVKVKESLSPSQKKSSQTSPGSKEKNAPVFVFTGDSVADQQRYDLAKEKYLKENPGHRSTPVKVSPQIPKSKPAEPVTGIKSDKVHFLVKALRPGVNVEPYRMALENFVRMDHFRFFDEERTILFENGDVSVTLLSAKSLKEKYGRRISPATIYNTKDARPVKFILSDDGRVKEMNSADKK